ncbi:MAG: hypothetical protein ABL982_23770 [Vicinamibacterales bacterium]
MARSLQTVRSNLEGVMRWIALALVGLGCEGVGLSCTEMGCTGTWTVSIDRALAEDAVVTVDLGDGDLRTCAVTAEPYSPCAIREVNGAAMLEVQVGMGQAPDTATVSIGEGGAEPTDYPVSITWGPATYPNGKACDGADGGCRSGESELSL